MSLLEKLKASGSIKGTTVAESKFFGVKEFAPTRIPIINAALSGTLDGGLSSGLTVIAGPSKHFKSNLGLVMVQAYMKRHKDAICLFYDSEFGVTPEYLEAHGIESERVLHLPIEHIEQLKFDMAKKLEDIKRGDKIIIFIDSVGNLASKKEVEDALDEKSVADMTRAKQMKSLFRIVTPHFTMKDIPCVVIGHTYDTQEMFSKKVLSGGCLLAGTKIQMADGTLKNIEDISPYDKVRTLLGPKEVTHTWNPETLADGEPECYEIEFEDGYKVTCSDKHRFIVNGEWVEARNLSEGQIVKSIDEYLVT
jgi:RecA/RadA recombinase